MGIDVFVRRTARTRVDERTRATGSRTMASTAGAAPAAPIAPPAQKAVDTTAAEWDVLALSGSGGVVAGGCASPEERRIAQGVFVALGASGREPATARFRWPPDGLADRDARSAATALAAFLRGQVERADAGCLVLLGDELAAVDVAVAVPVVRAPAARVLIGDADAKRRLWRQIATLRKR